MSVRITIVAGAFALRMLYISIAFFFDLLNELEYLWSFNYLMRLDCMKEGLMRNDDIRIWRLSFLLASHLISWRLRDRRSGLLEGLEKVRNAMLFMTHNPLRHKPLTLKTSPKQTGTCPTCPLCAFDACLLASSIHSQSP